MQGKGESSRSFCYIKDFGNAFRLIWEKGSNNQIYNIGNDHEVKIKEILDLLVKINGKEYLLNSETLPKGSTLRRCPDITKLKKLGYSPFYTIKDGLQKTNDWYLKNYV